MDPNIAPGQIEVDLPKRATVFELAMTAPDEGWLVGAIFAPDFKTTQSGLILRYRDRRWRPVDDWLPNAFLSGISMVSPTEGWVVGYNLSTGESSLLRLADGHWRPVALPYRPTGGSYFSGIRMRSPDEGWIVVHPWSSWRGDERSTHLLHYRDGEWTPLDDVPVPLVYDLAPVGPDELWLVGNDTTQNHKDSVLAHYHGGMWTTTPAPGRPWLGELRFLSPTDGYALGWQPEPPGPRYSSTHQPAAILRYDGAAWTPVQTGANPAAQYVTLFDRTDGWAFVRTPRDIVPPANDVVSAAQHLEGGRWRDVPWPFADIIGVGPVVRAAPGEYWAAAVYEVPPSLAENFHHELLHFAGGACREYPPR